MASFNMEMAIDHPGLAHPDHAYSDPPPPPPPMISSEGVVATDITQKFLSAAATLDPGQLVKDGFFTLFEAVGALEIMDPKMDSGCLAPGEIFDDEYDFTRQLLPSEVIGIIDQLLCLEMAWHLGYPLSQTLLTSVYIEAMLIPSPNNIHEAHFIRDPNSAAAQDPMATVLRAYCLGLLKACWYVNESISNEHFYEEEDFVTNTYHRSLLGNIDREEIREEIMSARRLVHSLRPDLPAGVADALCFRLELRTAFLRAIELSDLRSNPEALSLPWSHMQAVWEPINKSRELGKAVPEAFSTKIQRRLASTVPPRPIVQPSFEETYEHFKRLFRDGIDVLEVLNYADSQSLLNFVWTFQARKPQPLVYIRTMLQSFLFRDMVILGHLSIRHVMDDDLSMVVIPCSQLLDPANDAVEAPHDARFAIAHQMELFRQRAAQSYLDIFRALCQNRCRVRRTLCHSIQDWEAVQMEAEDIDQLLQVQLDEQPMTYPQDAPPGSPPAYSLPLSSWAYLYKLRLMEWIVQLGFELEVYQADELAGMYWYLSHLAKTRARHIERIQAFTVKRYGELRKTPAFPNPAFPTTPLEREYTRSMRYLRATLLDAVITWELAEALSCLYTVLLRLGLVAPPPRPYSTDELRYDIRMKPFAAVHLPDLPTFEEFTRQSEQTGVSMARLLDYAQAVSRSAQKDHVTMSHMSDTDAFSVGAHDRWAAMVKKRTQSVIAANVALSTMQSGLAKAGLGGSGADAPGAGEKVKQVLKAEVPKPEACYHDWWIVPKIALLQ
ncbi:N-alpha-acetyltransferase 35, NatC auxiliary subunit [Podospora conica]|nr:N-alpha-acetyltransferase 35, NatC auxiliary subunit [Schizothecium conicum]